MILIITLNNSLVIVQVLSGSMAQGLRFYQNRIKDLKSEDCSETISFCERMNDVFDALNLKIPKTNNNAQNSLPPGLKTGNHYYKVRIDILPPK